MGSGTIRRKRRIIGIPDKDSRLNELVDCLPSDGLARVLRVLLAISLRELDYAVRFVTNRRGVRPIVTRAYIREREEGVGGVVVLLLGGRPNARKILFASETRDTEHVFHHILRNCTGIVLKIVSDLGQLSVSRQRSASSASRPTTRLCDLMRPTAAVSCWCTILPVQSKP